MKRLFFLLALLPLAAAAQDCPIKKEKDQFSQQPKFTTGFMPFGQGLSRFLLSVDATKSEVDFFFALNSGSEGRCFNEASNVQVAYEGSRVKATYKNTGSMNCEGLFHFTFRNTTTTPSALAKLGTAKVASFKWIDSNKKEVVYELTDAEKSLLMERVACIIKEAKTLL